jgi:hypothetical protein
MKLLGLIFIGVSMAMPLAAQEAKTAAQQEAELQRSRIANERATEEAHYQQQRAECYQRFAVNDCLHQARVNRRPRMEELRRQEIILNDEERRRLASEQIQALEEKQQNKSAERPKP